MFEFLEVDLVRPFRLTCTDLNPTYLARLRTRLLSQGLSALIVADDVEHTSLVERPDLLLAVLLLEHIGWREGVEAITALRPAACGIIIQENPPEMATAVTPGRRIPPSIAAAVKIAQPRLARHEQMVNAFGARGYRCAFSNYREVADAKRLVSTLFVAWLNRETSAIARVSVRRSQWGRLCRKQSRSECREKQRSTRAV